MGYGARIAVAIAVTLAVGIGCDTVLPPPRQVGPVAFPVGLCTSFCQNWVRFRCVTSEFLHQSLSARLSLKSSFGASHTSHRFKFNQCVVKRRLKANTS